MKTVPTGELKVVPKLLVAIPTRGAVDGNCYASHINAMLDAVTYFKDRTGGIGVVDLFAQPRGHVVFTRTEVVRTALQNGHDWVYWIDDDMDVPRGTFEKLFELDKTWATGIAVQRGFPFKPCVFRGGEGGGVAVVDPEPNRIVQAVSAGMFCMLTSYGLLKDVWAATEGQPFQIPKKGGEDTFFGAIATKLGYRLWCDTSIRIGHVGTKTYTLEDWESTKKNFPDVAEGLLFTDKEREDKANVVQG